MCTDGLLLVLLTAAVAAVAVSAEVSLRDELAKAGGSAPALHRTRRDTCGGRFTHQTEEKIITSPNYPDDYHNSADCYYTIQVPPGHHVHITFDDFRVEIPRTSSSNCTYDGLAVRDGAMNIEPMGRYCGKVKPPNFSSRSNTVILHLYSDESLGFRGFKLRYKVLCGTAFFSDHGTLLFDENQPHISETNTCDYQLVTTPDKYLDLNFTVNTLMMTTVHVFDHGTVVRVLKSTNSYSGMDVRIVSTSNVVRVRFIYNGLVDGNAVIAYQTHPRTIVSGDAVFLFHMQTCHGLATDTGKVIASEVTKAAVAHRIEKVGGHQNDTISAGDSVYVRTLGGGARPLSLSATQQGQADYDSTASENSTWRLYGQLYHGGRIWLENKKLTENYLGVFGSVAGTAQEPAVHVKVGLCSPAVDWLVYKVPLDYGWYRYEARGAYQARWVDGLAAAASRDCLPHPLLFPQCGGMNRPQCAASP